MLATSDTFSTIVLEAGNDEWKSRALRALAPNARVERRADVVICESILGGLEERIVSGVPHPRNLYIPHHSRDDVNDVEEGIQFGDAAGTT